MRVFQPTYTKKAPPTTNEFGVQYASEGCVTRRSSVWWCEFTVDGKRHKVSTGLRDRNAAETRAAQIMREAELRAAGIETHGGTTRATLADLLTEYRAELTRRRCAPKHVETTLSRCAALTQGIASVAALTPTAVRLGLERLRGASAKTVNGYRTALSGFCSWLVREGRWASNPVEAVKRARETADGPTRRALTPEEQRALLDLGSPYRNVYIIALNTGLRRGEIESLREEDVVLMEPGRYAIRLRATGAKNRKEALLPLPTGVSLPKALAINKVPSMAAFRRDLKHAGIDPTNVDFHALRSTFATNLARSGAPLVLAQRLMRHSDPALTANIYTRLGINDEQAAVDRAVPDYKGSNYATTPAIAEGSRIHRAVLEAPVALPPSGPQNSPWAWGSE